MELLEGIETRRSIRAYKSIPVPKRTIESILKAASCSPSYTNTQPWEVAVVSGKKRDELSRILLEAARANGIPDADIPLPAAWPEALEKRSREHGAKRLKVIGVERDDEPQRRKLRLLNFEFYGAPCVLFLLMDSTLGPWSIFDMGLFAENIILAAHSYGLGSCLQASAVHYPDAVRKLLGIPETKKLVVGIALGYPDFEARLNSYHGEKIKPDSFTQWYA